MFIRLFLLYRCTVQNIKLKYADLDCNVKDGGDDDAFCKSVT